MDFHIVVVIGCVFLASFLSFLFINKIFRRKTFEEVVAEKKALTANLYAQNKAVNAGARKPKKKELKREKKQRQREQQKDAITEQEDEYSDGQSEEQASVEDEAPGLSKQHVEFEPDTEVVTYGEERQQRRASNAEKENQHGGKKGGKKDKRNASGSKTAVGILINKNEPVAVKQQTGLEESPALNHFEVRVPKDVVELKKQEQKERKEDNNKQQAKKNAAGGVGGGANKKEKVTVAIINAIEQPVEVPHLAKQIIKQQQQQPGNGSPKTQHNNVNNKTKQQQHAKKQKETLAAKDLVLALDKLAEHQTIGVSALMNVFARAELNRSEIQILIDYLLNKQQDMPASHAEWSDDICQKLKRQLEEKEKLLAEEQEASIGIQAKLRELRTEVNTERAQMHSRIQAYHDKLLGKEQELSALNQELAAANDKLALERQQFQAKLLREKQASSQDLLPQLQLQNEIIQKQVQQLRSLEQQRDELEARQNNSIFELEQRKQQENELAELEVELRNLHNALESAKGDLAQSQLEAGAKQTELSVEIQGLRQQVAALEVGKTALSQQLNQAASAAAQQSAVQSEQAQAQSDALQATLIQKEQQVNSLQAQVHGLNENQSAQQQQTSALQAQLQEAQQKAESLQRREHQLEQELQEQREKNNQQHQQLQQQQKQQQKPTNGGELNAISGGSAKAEQQRIRDLCQRLYPDAVKANAGNALNASFDEWVEQVLTTHIKQQSKPPSSSSNKSTQSNNKNNSISSNHSSTSVSTSTTTHNNINSSNSSSNSQATDLQQQEEELRTQNLKLRKRNDELTQLVTKTSNTLVDLEQRAREQDEHWRGIVSQKEQLIQKLQKPASNGEQDL